MVPPDQPITIEEGENVLEFTLEPMLVEFAVMAKLVDGEKEYPIEKLAIEGYRGQERLGCEDTNPQGLAVLCNIFPGELTLALKPTVRLTDGRMLRLAHSSRVAVYADGYQTEPAKVYYTYGPAAIEVRAVLLLNVDGKQKEIDLPGIPVAVYRGQSAIGAPLNTGTTDVRALIFPDLDQVDYTVAIASRNVTFRGQPLKLADGLSETWLAQVRAGHTQSIKFVFQPCAATVVGAVVDANCGAPLADVPFILASIDDPSVVISATSDSSGRLPFPNVPLGRYRALPARERLTLADGRTWELEKGGLSQSVERVIEVPASGTVQIDAPFKLVPERHRIYGMVTIGNQLVPHAIIDIYDDQGKLVRTVESDTLGKYEAEVERAGNYHVTVRMVLGAPVQPAQRFPVKVASDAELNLPLPGSERNASLFGGVSPVPPPPANGQLRDAAVDLSAYPVLTTEVSATASPQPVGGAGGAPLGQVVEGALREVLAWRPRASDPKGFVAALNQSFTCSEAEGRSVCTWTPRSYAVQVDLGAVTGAQASIYMRAKAALDQSLPLLEGLYPLRPDADEQDIEANRAIINSNEVELVNELGVQGGPRAARVDALFDSLLGGNDATPSTIDELVPDSQFGQMRDLFGFTPAFVNTVDEEQNLTNFIILVDHASALRRSWVAQRDFFTGRGGAEPFFGTQMILLSRSLAVVVEAVEETSFVMDSVFLDSAERQTLELTYANEHPIFLGELLRWAYDFASTEAPRLIQEGGKSGVIAVTPTLERLERLVRGAMLRPDGEQDPAAFPAGYRTARVQRSLQELSSHLAEALELASEIRRNGLANARFGRRFVRR